MMSLSNNWNFDTFCHSGESRIVVRGSRRNDKKEPPSDGRTDSLSKYYAGVLW